MHHLEPPDPGRLPRPHHHIRAPQPRSPAHRTPPPLSPPRKCRHQLPCSCQQIRQHNLTSTNPEHSDTSLQEGQYEVTVATVEDKIVQRAVAAVLNAIYEEDFLGFSYGFRPGRKPHDALDALAVGIEKRKVNWILDADIRGFLDPWSYCSFADCAG